MTATPSGQGVEAGQRLIPSRPDGQGSRGQLAAESVKAIVFACACARESWQGRAKKRRARLGRGALQNIGGAKFSEALWKNWDPNPCKHRWNEDLSSWK